MTATSEGINQQWPLLESDWELLDMAIDARNARLAEIQAADLAEARAENAAELAAEYGRLA